MCVCLCVCAFVCVYVYVYVCVWHYFYHARMKFHQKNTVLKVPLWRLLLQIFPREASSSTRRNNSWQKGPCGPSVATALFRSKPEKSPWQQHYPIVNQSRRIPKKPDTRQLSSQSWLSIASTTKGDMMRAAFQGLWGLCCFHCWVGQSWLPLPNFWILCCGSIVWFGWFCCTVSTLHWPSFFFNGMECQGPLVKKWAFVCISSQFWTITIQSRAKSISKKMNPCDPCDPSIYFSSLKRAFCLSVLPGTAQWGLTSSSISSPRPHGCVPRPLVTEPWCHKNPGNTKQILVIHWVHFVCLAKLPICCLTTRIYTM